LGLLLSILRDEPPLNLVSLSIPVTGCIDSTGPFIVQLSGFVEEASNPGLLTRLLDRDINGKRRKHVIQIITGKKDDWFFINCLFMCLNDF
jgi:hypothetical protein